MVSFRDIDESQRLALPATYVEECSRPGSGSASDWFHIAVELQHHGKLEQSESAFRQLLSIEPNHIEGMTNLAIVLARLCKREEAEAAFREAIRLSPQNAKAHNNFGVLLAETGRRKEALDCWRQAAESDPQYPEAHFNLAMALAETGDKHAAVERYEHSLRLKPDYAEALNNLGLLYHEMSRPHDAVILLEQAVRLRPDYVEAWNNLALSRVDVGRGEEAIAAYREALRLHPNEAEIHNNLGTALAALNRPEEALACYRHALRLKPDYPEVRWHQALTWLTLGDFKRGWPEYEWRWRRRRSRPRSFEGPLWDGALLPGKSLLLWCEQGLGDSIQFARYIALAKERVGHVILEGPAVLRPLLSSCKGVDQWIDAGESLPEFAAHAPLMTLPKIFETSLASVPNQTPYLFAEAAKVAEWQGELNEALPAGNLRVGIAWQGNPHHRWDRHRSFSIHRFEELAQTPGVSLVSLQKGPGADQLSEFRRQHSVLDLGTRADPDGVFRDTPGIVANLDLVICCDTSLAHLAGAMNIPVWIPLAKMADWRWLRLRSDSPWYPSLRLFRQKQHGEWSDVFDKIARELRTWAAKGETRHP